MGIFEQHVDIGACGLEGNLEYQPGTSGRLMHLLVTGFGILISAM